MLNSILENGVTEDADRILEIDVADANLYETILDNFSKKLEDKDQYFPTLNCPSLIFSKNMKARRKRNHGICSGKRIRSDAWGWQGWHRSFSYAGRY